VYGFLCAAAGERWKSSTILVEQSISIQRRKNFEIHIKVYADKREKKTKAIHLESTSDPIERFY
jgi:hypothetical protein